MNIPTDCTKCGACCSNPDPKWVEVTAADAQRIPATNLQPGAATPPGAGPFAMTQDGERCSCLVGQIGRNAHCSIYLNRPTICRSVTPGSPICLASLARYGVK